LRNSTKQRWQRLRCAGHAGTRIEIMMRPVLATIAAAALLGAGIQPGGAQTSGNAPWCAVIDQGTGNVVHECYYQSAAECAPNVVAGNRGFCNVNPYWTGPIPGFAPASRGKHRVQ
jgi:hypothetical protein